MPDPAQLRFFHPLRVRWTEVDAQNIASTANAAVAITEYFRTLGIAYPADLGRDGGDFFAVRTALEYGAFRRRIAQQRAGRPPGPCQPDLQAGHLAGG